MSPVNLAAAQPDCRGGKKRTIPQLVLRGRGVICYQGRCGFFSVFLMGGEAWCFLGDSWLVYKQRENDLWCLSPRLVIPCQT